MQQKGKDNILDTRSITQVYTFSHSPLSCPPKEASQDGCSSMK